MIANLNITISPEAFKGLEGSLEEIFNRVKQPVQNAMADVFHQTVMANFGQSGLDRPWEWADLEPGYAKKVHRTYATLYVDGKLASAVKVEYGENCASVSISKDDVVYALIHQFGGQAGKNHAATIPARPYFPIDERGQIMPYTLKSCLEIAELQLRKELQ